MSVTKLDFRKTLKPFYSPSAGEAQLIRVPAMKYIMVDGGGQPGGEEFQLAMGVIYNLAYTMKFKVKAKLRKDYNVMAPEGLWWFKGDKAFDQAKPKDWLWTLMVVVPDFITDAIFDDVVEEVRRKKNPPGLDRAHLEQLAEGECVQIMHVGPYSSEAESISRMDACAKEHGYRMVGKHHEIYLGDPRRAAPAKLRTILRHPVAKAS